MVNKRKRKQDHPERIGDLVEESNGRPHILGYRHFLQHRRMDAGGAADINPGCVQEITRDFLGLGLSKKDTLLGSDAPSAHRHAESTRAHTPMQGSDSDAEDTTSDADLTRTRTRDMEPLAEHRPSEVTKAEEEALVGALIDLNLPCPSEDETEQTDLSVPRSYQHGLASNLNCSAQQQQGGSAPAAPTFQIVPYYDFWNRIPVNQASKSDDDDVNADPKRPKTC